MKRGGKGFTLIEVLVVIALTGVIIGPLAMVTTTLLTNPQRSTDQNVVLQQVQNAGHWISRDIQMAGNVTIGDTNGFPLTLTIPVNDNPDNDYTIDYVFDGSKLKRQVDDSSGTLIADYIDIDNTTLFSLNPDADLYKLTVRAAKGEAAVTRSYEVSQRLN